MRSKGAILFFAILLTLVCIYQLSFTYVTYRERKIARQLSGGDLMKETMYLDSISNLSKDQWKYLGNTFKECQEKEINLGLDLKGGMNVILEISVVDIIRTLSNYSMDTTFNIAIRRALEQQKNSQEDFITLFGRAFEEIDPDARLAAVFNTVELRDKVDFNTTNDEVLRVLRNEANDAIDNAYEILNTRIDRFGVVQPNISRLQTQGRILIELPGIKDPARVRKLLQGSAKLEFWETYENSELYPNLFAANGRLKEILDAQKVMIAGGISPAEETKETASREPALETDRDTTELSLLEKIEQDTAGVDSLQMMRDMEENYPLFAVLRPNQTSSGNLMPGSEIGMALASDTATVMRYLRMEQIRALFPREVRFQWDVAPVKINEKETNYYYLHAIKVTSRDGRAPLGGEVITSARPEFTQGRAYAKVNMSMNGEGAKVWARLTRDNVNRRVAVVLDGLVYSSATVQGEIKGGNTEITGNFTIEEATDLANILKSGKMPATARIIQEAIVGPSLGKDAIKAGLNSFIIAFIIILFYMVFYYSHRAGLIADLALIANMFFLMGVLASLGPVLTLPGIAGIILTVGMSVDANVLIYERIREELRAGKGIKLAISDGFKYSMSPIIDANITTLLTGIILYVFGTGPIKGFATTLVLGILTTLFSAIFITRLIFEAFLTKNYKLTFITAATERFFQNTKIDFLKKRKIFYFVSAAIMVIGIISLVVRGLSPSVDFTGGRNYVIKFHDEVNTTDVREALAGVLEEPPQVITYGSSNAVRISTQFMIDSAGDNTDRMIEERLFSGLSSFYPESFTLEEFIRQDTEKDAGLMSSQMVGPTIADDIKIQAVWAILFSLIGIFIYIFIRFRNWRFGFAGVLALFHDAAVVLICFSLFYGIMPFSMEVDQSFIAAILTVVGFSINDTVVIFDRIREYVGLYPKRDRKEIVNSALNSTLNRTFNTSFTVFLTLLMMFFFGGEVIRGFIFALLVGVISGTYSTIFIATPIVIDMAGETGEAAGLTKGIRRT